MMDMGGGSMGGGQGGDPGQGQMVPCPCCGGQGVTTPEMAEKCEAALGQEPAGDDAAGQLAAAMSGPKAPMRKG